MRRGPLKLCRSWIWRLYLWIQGHWDKRRVPPVIGGDPPRPLRVICEAPIVWNRKSILQAAGMLRDKTAKDVHIHALAEVVGRTPEGNDILQGKAMPPQEDGSFHIWIWSTPRDGGSQDPPERLFSRPYSPVGPCFSASGLGLPVESVDFTAGELVGNNLYIHCPLGFRLDDEEARIFRSLIVQVMPLLELPDEERERKLAEQKKSFSSAGT